MAFIKRAWGLALFWVPPAFVFLLLVGSCVTQPAQKGQDQQKYPACDYVMEATFSIAGHRVLIPVVLGTEINFPHRPDAPDLLTRASVEALAPPTPEALGFCGELLTGQTDPEYISFEGKAVEGFAAKLELPSTDTIRRLTIGTKGMTALLAPDAIRDGVSAEMVLISDAGQSGYLSVKFFETAGWLESGHRLSFMCLVNELIVAARCNVRVTRRSDGMVFAAYGLQLDAMPKENAPPPKEFLILAERLPKLLELLRAPDAR